VELGNWGVHAASNEHAGPVYCDVHTQAGPVDIVAARPFPLQSCPNASGASHVNIATCASKSFNLMLMDMLLLPTCVPLPTAY
jgi:hypothetical protein